MTLQSLPHATGESQTVTNSAQTIVNNGKRDAVIWPTSRKSQMVWLAVLTAITLVGQYIMLGAAGLQARELLNEQFKYIELALWGARALVEIFVVVYIAMTKTSTPAQSRSLLAFEVVLITLIVLTVGPVWLEIQLNTNIVGVLTKTGAYVWGFALAGISAVMLAGAATAYKYQPVAEDYVMLTEAEKSQLLALVGQAEQSRAEAVADVGEAEAARNAALAARDRALMELDATREAVRFMSVLPGSLMVQMVARFSAGRPDAKTLAEAFDLSESTVRGVLAKTD